MFRLYELRGDLFRKILGIAGLVKSYKSATKGRLSFRASHAPSATCGISEAPITISGDPREGMVIGVIDCAGLLILPYTRITRVTLSVEHFSRMRIDWKVAARSTIATIIK